VTTLFKYTYDSPHGAPLEKGKTWNYSQEVIPSMGNPATKAWSTEILGIEDVTVPAGTFSCYKVVHKTGDKGRTEWWSTADNFITPVKVADEVSYEFVETSELKSYIESGGN
jgi:hypothetical protein